MSAVTPVAGGAAISADGLYRYELVRRWSDELPLVRFIMLNPSTADAVRDDRTIRRCQQFAADLGYGGILVHNLFGLRATDPRELREHPDPVGPDNDSYLGCVGMAIDTVCAWGADGDRHGRARVVRRLLRTARDQHRPIPPAVMCLGLTAAGHPRHPLYLPAATRPKPFQLKDPR